MDYERVLETYSLEDILEWNDITPEELLEMLVNMELIHIPEPKPVDIND